MPIEQILISAGQEGAAAAGGIEDTQLGGFVGSFSFQQFADRVFHDVVDDIGGRVINAAGFADFGFLFHPRRAAFAEFDDLAEEAFVYLAEDIGGQYRKLVGTVGIIEFVDEVAQRFVAESGSISE